MVHRQAPGCGNVDIVVKDQHSFTLAQLAARVDTEHNPDVSLHIVTETLRVNSDKRQLAAIHEGFPPDLGHW